MKEILKMVVNVGKKAYVNHSQIYFRLTGYKVECNLCHYKANRFFSDSWHLYVNCPSCSSSIRHRLVWAALTQNSEFEEIIKNKRVLHFAPNKKLGNKIKEKAREYFTADLLVNGYSYSHIDFNLDISNMEALKDEEMDCIIALDVLEHVPNQFKAISEVYRILKPGGYCIFTVPQKDGLNHTYEDLSIKDPQLRKKLFGQHDHLRIYGKDFSKIIESHGFGVQVIDESNFDIATAKKHVLYPPVKSDNPLATNFRKVYFGKKM